MKFYHYVMKDKLDSILKKGLLPTKSEKLNVFLWDSYDLAVAQCTILARDKPVEIAILEVDVPPSWVNVDHNYCEFEYEYEHSVEVKKRIDPKRIKLKGKILVDPSRNHTSVM